MRKGQTVVDRLTGEPAVIAAVQRVPVAADLFGVPIPGHMRYVLRFEDGRWANDRRGADLDDGRHHAAEPEHRRRRVRA